jgi:hypothetical protein
VVADFKVSINNHNSAQRGIRIERSDPDHQNVVQEIWLSCGLSKPSFTYTFPEGATVDAFSPNEYNFALVRENSQQRLIVPAPVCPPPEPSADELEPETNKSSSKTDEEASQAVEDLRTEIQEKDGW